VKSTKLASVGAAVGAATTVTALLLSGTAATAAEAPATRPETAFAFATKGLLPLGPLAKVSSPDGTPQHAELLGLASVPGATAAGFSGGVLTSDAKAGLATTSVANLKLSTLLSGDLIKTTCDNGKGSVEIVNGTLLGSALPSAPMSGQTLDLSPVAKATLGEETRNADGSITVTGVKISVLTDATGAVLGLPDLKSVLGGLTGGTNPVGGVVPAAYSQPLVTDPGDPGADTGTDPGTDAGTVTTQDATGTDAAPVAVPAAPAAPAAPSIPGVGTIPGVQDLVGAIPGVGSVANSLPTGALPGTSTTTATGAAQNAALTITIGSATCGTVASDGGHGHGPGDGDDNGDHHGKDHDKNKHHGSDDSDADDNDGSDDSDSGDAPAPDVVQANLPVTG
jgi:hypothetical protein